jgi:chromosome segregation ATPase
VRFDCAVVCFFFFCLFFQELTELKGEPLTMRLEIKKCMGLPQKYSSKVFVKYRFFYDSTEHQTEACGDTTINPLLNYERTLLVDIIEDEFVEYVKSGVLELSVYGEQPVYDDDDEEKDGTAGTASTKARGGRGSKRATAKAGSSKRNSMTPGDSSSSGGDASARIAKLEAVLRDITASVAPDASADSLLKDAPEELVGRVKDLVVKKASLEEENFVLKSPEKARPASSAEGAVVNEEAAAAAAALQAENEKIKAELESLRSKGASASGAADAEAAALRAELEALRQAPPAAASAPLVDENASLKAALESLKSKATPSASELAELRQSKEAQERALAAGEAELAALRATLATKENEAAELRALQEREATLNRELQEKLGAAKSDEDLASLRKELDSARAKVAAAGQSADRDAELEELRRQLKEEQEKKKSSACVIL